jgi:hypothetical protein
MEGTAARGKLGALVGGADEGKNRRMDDGEGPSRSGDLDGFAGNAIGSGGAGGGLCGTDLGSGVSGEMKPCGA